jgi:hypothetical protein
MARTAGRRLRTAILLTLLSLVVPIIAVALGVAILRVLGAFALLFIGPLIKVP